MNNDSKSGFTLIELVAVLVVLAIIALIVAPLAMNIIRNARISADRRSVDAYGRTLELSIASYLLNHGDFPSDVGQLTVEYTGNRVSCSTTQINDNATVYLAGCTVGGRSVNNYTYGTNIPPTYDVYEVGDEVSYNGVDYYAIENSGASKATVALIKKNPLTVAEVNLYGDGHVNMYATTDTSAAYYQQAYDMAGDGTVGGMQYYSSASCNFTGGGSSGCTSNYDNSEIKYVVDAFALAKTKAGDLVNDSNGYKARLLTYDELFDNLGYEKWNPNTSMGEPTASTPDFMTNDGGNSYRYWTMSVASDSTKVWYLSSNGSFSTEYVYGSSSAGRFYCEAVRPVINILKSAL